MICLFITALECLGESKKHNVLTNFKSASRQGKVDIILAWYR